MFAADAFVSECRAALREGPRAPVAVKEILEHALERPAEIEAALPAERGGFRPLYHASDLTVLAFVWPPGVSLFPHDHMMWATVGLYGGREDNTFFRRTEDGIEATGGKSLHARDVLVLGDDAIHAVENPSRSWTGALHVYGGDFYSAARTAFDSDTGASRPFDVDEANRVLTDADVVARASES